MLSMLQAYKHYPKKATLYHIARQVGHKLQILKGNIAIHFITLREWQTYQIYLKTEYI
jgi:hypothetical protein